jgi:hypothetical protein
MCHVIKIEYAIIKYMITRNPVIKWSKRNRDIYFST